jgi:hypothetical protein
MGAYAGTFEGRQRLLILFLKSSGNELVVLPFTLLDEAVECSQDTDDLPVRRSERGNKYCSELRQH